MEITYSVWAFVISLAAVINGLGIVRLLGGFSEFLRKREALEVSGYWVFTVLVAFQLFLHVLLWWSLLSVREAGTIDYLKYIYLLAGPTLLFLSTSFLEVDIDSGAVDLRDSYARMRRPYYSLAIAFWSWAIFLWPVFVGRFAPTIVITIPMLAISVVLRMTSNPRLHAGGVLGFWALYLTFVGLYGMHIGAVGRVMTQG
jgi:hypothetical protein